MEAAQATGAVKTKRQKRREELDRIRAEQEAEAAAQREAQNREERARIRAEHHKQMLTRASERGVTLHEEPPARGGGMGAGPHHGAGKNRHGQGN